MINCVIVFIYLIFRERIKRFIKNGSLTRALFLLVPTLILAIRLTLTILLANTEAFKFASDFVGENQKVFKLIGEIKTIKMCRSNVYLRKSISHIEVDDRPAIANYNLCLDGENGDILVNLELIQSLETNEWSITSWEIVE